MLFLTSFLPIFRTVGIEKWHNPSPCLLFLQCHLSPILQGCSSFGCSLHWSPEWIIYLHLLLASCSFCPTNSLYFLLYYICGPSLWSSSFPPMWQLHIQHPLSNISTRLNHLILASLTIVFKPLNLSSSSDILVSNLLHPGHFQQSIGTLSPPA